MSQPEWLDAISIQEATLELSKSFLVLLQKIDSDANRHVSPALKHQAGVAIKSLLLDVSNITQILLKGIDLQADKTPENRL